MRKHFSSALRKYFIHQGTSCWRQLNSFDDEKSHWLILQELFPSPYSPFMLRLCAQKPVLCAVLCLRKSPFNISKRKSTSNVDVLTIRDRGWWKCFDKMITGAWKQTLHVPQSFLLTKENQNLSLWKLREKFRRTFVWWL